MTVNRDGKRCRSGPLAEYLALQTGFESFRTHKGVINSGLLCELTLVNPNTSCGCRFPPSRSPSTGNGNQTPVPRTISYYDSEKKENKTADLLTDVVSNGVLRVRSPLPEPGAIPRNGASRPVRADGGPAFRHRVFQSAQRGVAGSDCGGHDRVAASCFLKGPIATLLTFAVLIVGQAFRELVDKIVTVTTGRWTDRIDLPHGDSPEPDREYELSKPVETTIKLTDKGVENGLCSSNRRFLT